MKYTELQRKSKAELETMLQESRKDLQQTNFSVASGQEKHVRKLRDLKRQIAQILTLLHSSKHNEND